MRKMPVLLSIVVLTGVLGWAASADWPDGPDRPHKYEYSRELFTGSFPTVNNQIDLLLVGRTVLGDAISVDENVIYVPVGERVRFHAVSLDANYVVRVATDGNKDPLLDFGVTGGGEGAGQLTHGLYLKETRDLVLLKNGEDRVGKPVKLVPLG